MNILVDESVDQQSVVRLRDDGHDVLSVAEMEPGIDDDTVLQTARCYSRSTTSNARRSIADGARGE